MPKHPLAMTLAKVLIAAAWADGELANDEVNSLKHLLAQLGYTVGSGEMALGMQDWAELDIYLYSPVGPDERRRLVADLARAMRGSADKALAFAALDQLLAADRVTTEAERAVAAELLAALDQAETGPLAALGGMLRRSFGQPSATATGPNREQYLDEFLNNRVYYAVRVRLGKAPEEDLGIPAAEARTLALAGGILAMLARVDNQVSEAERERIVTALAEGWGISHDRATLVAEVALAESAAHLDDYTLTYRFAQSTTIEERVGFLDALFAVAAADGTISSEESAAISRITSSIRLEQRHFVAAKRKALGRQEASER